MVDSYSEGRQSHIEPIPVPTTAPITPTATVQPLPLIGFKQHLTHVSPWHWPSPPRFGISQIRDRTPRAQILDPVNDQAKKSLTYRDRNVLGIAETSPSLLKTLPQHKTPCPPPSSQPPTRPSSSRMMVSISPYGITSTLAHTSKNRDTNEHMWSSRPTSSNPSSPPPKSPTSSPSGPSSSPRPSRARTSRTCS